MRDERITFQEFSETTNDYGETEKAWANITTTPTMWADAVPITSGEDFNAEQRGGFQRYRFVVLWRDDLDETMRISWNSKYWDVRSITPIHRKNGKQAMRNRELEIIAEWRQNQY